MTSMKGVRELPRTFRARGHLSAAAAIDEQVRALGAAPA